MRENKYKDLPKIFDDCKKETFEKLVELGNMFTNRHSFKNLSFIVGGMADGCLKFIVATAASLPADIKVRDEFVKAAIKELKHLHKEYLKGAHNEK